MSTAHRWRGAAIVLPLIAASCTPLPTTSSVVIPPIPSGVARLWFYRDYEPYETLARPYVRLNQQVFGISEPGGAFYRDVAPAHYSITVDSAGRDVNQFAEVDLGAGGMPKSCLYEAGLTTTASPGAVATPSTCA